MSLEQSGKYTGAKKVCFEDVSKDWKSKMKNVGKYCVY